MDIRVTSTNRIFYQIDSQLGALLCDALPTVFERADNPAAAPTPARPRWSVGTGLHKGETFLRIVCDSCKRNTVYVGRVEDIPQFEKSLCIHAGMVPDDVRAEYRAKYTGNLEVVMAKPTEG